MHGAFKDKSLTAHDVKWYIFYINDPSTRTYIFCVLFYVLYHYIVRAKYERLQIVRTIKKPLAMYFFSKKYTGKSKTMKNEPLYQLPLQKLILWKLIHHFYW